MKLSVALCTYHGGKYLPAQLESLLAQTRRPDELVVGDDASSDETPAILERFAAVASFPVRIHRHPSNLGCTANFDHTLGLCTGDVIFLCDQDDVWDSSKLARFSEVFEAEPSVGIVASDLELIDADGKLLGRRVWKELPFTPRQQAAIEAGGGPGLWVRYNTITGAAAAFRSEFLQLIRPIPTSWVHDGWAALMAAAVSRIRLIPEPLTRYRSHSGQQIGSEPLTLRRQIRAARRMNAAYFANVAVCFEAAAERLEPHRARLLDPETIALLRGKAAFARAQQRMREGWRPGRLLPALREMLAGGYSRYGRGWKGFAADLLL